MKKIIATSYHTGGINAISPVINNVRMNGRLDVSVVGYGISIDTFKKKGIHCDYKPYNVSVDNMEYLLKEIAPDLVLTGQSSQNKERDVIDQTITLAAREQNIPTLSVSESWTNRLPYFSDTFSGEKFKFLPDYITVIDDIQKDIMIQEGFPEDILIITGNPYFDSLKSLSDNFNDLRKVRKDLGLELDSYLILFASGPIESYYGSNSSNPRYLGYTEKTVLTDLMEAIDNIRFDKKIELLVKAHRDENKEELKDIIKRYGKKYRVDQDYDTQKAVLVSDLIASTFSNVLIEASYMDKLGASLQHGLIKDDMLITNKIGVTVPVYHKNQLLPTLENLIFNEEYKKRIAEKRREFRTDGKATERVVKLIYDILDINPED